VAAVDEVDARTAPDEVLRAFWEVEAACHEEASPGEPLRSVDEVIAFLRFQPTTHVSCHWRAAGGTASLYVHGPTAAFAHVRVAPDARRRGVGTALATAAIERSRELDVRALHAHHTTGAGASFARRLGAVDGQRIVRSLLALRDAELPEPRPPDRWRLLTWLERVPDEHLEALVRVRRAMDDAPAPEEMDFPSWTAEKQRASEESLRQRDREMRVTVAMRDDGEIGAFTELRVSRGATLGFTDDTGTATPFRGRGLARAVKVESLRRLREDRREIDVVSTDNAEENVVMRHINESVGFRPTVVETTATLTL
jgi:GNAT superfamily N-acetyltransferase/RimJ/RimL family protein N-acetyltransferase